MTRFETVGRQVTSASPDQVMRTLRDATTWSRWQPEIQHAEGSESLAPGDAVVGKASMLGFAVHGRSTIVEVGELSLEEDVIVGVRMRIRFEISDGGGTTVTHRLSSDMPGGAMGRVLTFFLKRRLVKMQRTALKQLAQVAESVP